MLLIVRFLCLIERVRNALLKIQKALKNKLAMTIGDSQQKIE